MPDKQNENKFMAMLERRGIVRKADPEDESIVPDADANNGRQDMDLQSLFASSDPENKNVTPAARQPVPGIVTPVLPYERTQAPERVESRPTERVIPLQTSPASRAEPEPPRTPEPSRTPEPPKPPEPSRTPEPPKPPDPEIVRQPRTEPAPAPAPVSVQAPLVVAVDPFREEAPKSSIPENRPVDVPTFEQPPQPPAPEDTTERYLDINELYEVLSLRQKKTDTIFLVEEYLKTLPDSIPDESRRDIVGKIVAASGFNYDLLMGDGVLRLKMLKDYSERFAHHTEAYVAARQTELEELDQHILRIRKLIENRRDLHKKQAYTIEAEAQRLKDILNFISG